MTLARRPLGKTGLSVSALGLGCGPLGDARLDDRAADELLRAAVEAGVDVFDTAPSYGASEPRLGRFLATLAPAERDALVIVTKGGYGVAGVEDWTPEVVRQGIDQALVRLATDRIDVFLLHSCPRERLERGDLFAPLEHAKASGKLRAFGYSGDGDALAWAVASESFDVVECSVNVVDQEALSLPLAASGLGVFAKRTLANAAWADASSPYAGRWSQLFATPPRLPPDELAVRFTAHASGVASALVGTSSRDRLLAAVAHVARGPLPPNVVAELEHRFATLGHAWPGII